MTIYRYVVYAYTKEAYGTTGREFDNDLEKAISVSNSLQNSTGVIHGVMVYVPGDPDFKRRLVYKDGKEVSREKREVLSTNCKIVMSTVKDFLRVNKRVPTVSEICERTYKPKHFIEKTLARLHDAKLIEINNLSKINDPYKLKK